MVVRSAEAKYQKPPYSSYILAYLQDLQAKHTTRFINPILSKISDILIMRGGSDVFVCVSVKDHA